MENIAWMAWTLPTAIFFVLLSLTLGVMTWLAVAYPEAERGRHVVARARAQQGSLPRVPDRLVRRGHSRQLYIPTERIPH